MGQPVLRPQFAFLSKREPISRLFHNSSPESQGNLYLIVSLLNGLPQNQLQPMPTAKRVYQVFIKKIKFFGK